MKTAKPIHIPPVPEKRTFFQRIKEPYGKDEIKAIMDYVSKLYGIKTQRQPPSCKVMRPPPFFEYGNKTFSVLTYPIRFFSYILTSYSAFYYPKENTIFVHPRFHLPNALLRRNNPEYILVHECTHAFQQPLKMEGNASMDTRKWLAMYVANEGMAKFAEFKYLEENCAELERFAFSRNWFFRAFHYLRFFIEKALDTILDPVRGAHYLISKIVSHLLNINQRASLADASPRIFQHFIREYEDGIYFFGELCRIVGPECAFRLVSENPPTCMKEIADPDFYLRRTISDFCKKS